VAAPPASPGLGGYQAEGEATRGQLENFQTVKLPVRRGRCHRLVVRTDRPLAASANLVARQVTPSGSLVVLAGAAQAESSPAGYQWTLEFDECAGDEGHIELDIRPASALGKGSYEVQLYSTTRTASK
jgi:hypothetical protein